MSSDVRHVRRAVLPGSPAQVWPWLAQMGDGRAGWYSLDLLERLLGASGSVDGWRSLDRVDPALVDLAVGDRVPLGRGASLRVATADPPHHLRLVFDEPVGPAHLVFDWSFVLGPGSVPDTTDLVVSTGMVGRPRPWAAWLVRWVLAPGHRVMEAAQVRGLRRRLHGRGA